MGVVTFSPKSYEESQLGKAKTLCLRLTRIVALFLLGALGTNALVFAQNLELPTIIDQVKWHPRGEGLIVTGRGSPGVWGLWLFDTDMQLVRFFATENSVSVDWSPDGTRFSIGRTILDAQTFDVVLTLNAISGIGGWSSDGTQVLAWIDERHLGLFDAQSGLLARSVPIGEMIPDAVSWSPNGAYFALLQPTGMTEIINAENGRRITTIPMEYPIGLRWSPDSRYLAAAFLTVVEPGTPNTLPDAASPTIASVVVWEAISGSVIQTYSGLPATPLRLRWHPQKLELAGGSAEGLIFIWDIETSQQVNVFKTLSSLTSMEYSPFGGRLVIGSWTAQQAAFATQLFPMATPVGWTRDIVSNTLQVIIPDPSIELLQQNVEAACVRLSAALTITEIDSRVNIDSFIDTVRQNEEIQPGCAAELIELAQAVQATR
jgi:WD40 repeat protein